MMFSSWPVARISGPSNRQTPIPSNPLITEIHKPIRVVRRTVRSAGARSPSSAAITAATAPVSPESAHSTIPNSATASAEAASCASPSRAMKITSTA